jgi:hypothetical protein
VELPGCHIDCPGQRRRRGSWLQGKVGRIPFQCLKLRIR